jgi:hypothetical protein
MIDVIAELWAAGTTFTDMATRLGVSRSIVAGRIDRARKSGDPRFAPRPKPVVAPSVAMLRRRRSHVRFRSRRTYCWLIWRGMVAGGLQVSARPRFSSCVLRPAPATGM